MAEEPSENIQTTPRPFRRPDDFASLYANNVQFETSVWDLKLLFGQLDQSETPNFVEQHTAVTLPWVQAKLCAYFLTLNVLINQALNGKIEIPNSVMPTRPDMNDPSLDEAGRKTVKYFAWVYDQFFGSDPYIPPDVDPKEP